METSVLVMYVECMKLARYMGVYAAYLAMSELSDMVLAAGLDAMNLRQRAYGVFIRL